ncbi:MAG: glycosyltransferase family 39 protein, partial [Ignavibacteriales bacterium]|nr:glycosyltransferase family 39 protein [Ignavibacteriales bacterium]
MSTLKRSIVAALFILAGTAVRFYHLEDQSLWNDEMFSLDVASTALVSIQTKLVAYYHHPPLFFYLAHVTLSWFGQTAWALRFPSALFGSLTVGLVCFCAGKLFNPRAGIIAGLFCLFSPLHLAYSQEGRPYALAGFLCLSSFYLLYSNIQEKKLHWMILYIVTLVALLYTHHWGIFVVASHVIAVALFSPASWMDKRRLLISWMIVGLAYLPELFALRSQMLTTSADGWFWVDRPNFNEVYHLLTLFSGTYFKIASSVFELPVYMQAVGITAIALVIAISIGRAASPPWRARSNGNVGGKVVLICFSGTLLVPFLISFFKPEVFVWYRFPVIGFPLLCVLVGGITERWKALTIPAAVVLIVGGSVGSVQYFSWSKANPKDVAAYVDTVSRQQHVRMIIRPKEFAPLLNYYYKGDAIQYDEAYLETPLGEIVDTAASFMYISLDVPNEIRAYMDRHFEKTTERRFP